MTQSQQRLLNSHSKIAKGPGVFPHWETSFVDDCVVVKIYSGLCTAGGASCKAPFRRDWNWFLDLHPLYCFRDSDQFANTVELKESFNTHRVICPHPSVDFKTNWLLSTCLCCFSGPPHPHPSGQPLSKNSRQEKKSPEHAKAFFHGSKFMGGLCLHEQAGVGVCTLLNVFKGVRVHGYSCSC